MCKYSFEFKSFDLPYSCNKKEEYKDGFCIFHCDKENFTYEENKKFEIEFQKEFERQKKEEKEFNFTGFKFPDKISFKLQSF